MALIILPGVVLSVIAGQNGFITAGLAGLFALAFLKGQARAGVYVGLLSIKPHLALGIGFLLLISRNWRALFITAITAALCAVVATGVFGFPIWGAFFEAARQAKVFLEAGLYPIHKMTSVYAALFPWIGASKAMIAQIVVTLLSFLLIAFAYMQRWNPRLLVGFTLLASLTMSPYLYYYDLLFLGLFFALTADQFVASSKIEKFALVALAWVSMAWMLVQPLFTRSDTCARPTSDLLLPPNIAENVTGDGCHYTLAGFALLGLTIAAFVVLRPHAVRSPRVKDAPTRFSGIESEALTPLFDQPEPKAVE